MTATDKLTDAEIDEALASALGPDAQDTALLSRSVLTRITQTTPARRPPLAEVLAAPLPMASLFLSTLGLAAALGHLFVLGEFDDFVAVIILFGAGV